MVHLASRSRDCVPAACKGCRSGVTGLVRHSSEEEPGSIESSHLIEWIFVLASGTSTKEPTNQLSTTSLLRHARHNDPTNKGHPLSTTSLLRPGRVLLASAVRRSCVPGGLSLCLSSSLLGSLTQKFEFFLYPLITLHQKRRMLLQTNYQCPIAPLLTYAQSMAIWFYNVWSIICNLLKERRISIITSSALQVHWQK